MRFYEKKLKTRYKYFAEDVFGKLEITSKEKLNGKSLDDVLSAILKVSSGGGKIIKGDIKDTEITYKLTKINQWEKIKN